MRTSGTGADGWMTAIPIAILVVFLMVIAGGRGELFNTLERFLQAMVEWAVGLVS